MNRFNQSSRESKSVSARLPIVKLSEGHYKTELTGWRLVYYHVHTMLGYLLGTLLLGRFAGIVG